MLPLGAAPYLVSGVKVAQQVMRRPDEDGRHFLPGLACLEDDSNRNASESGETSDVKRWRTAPGVAVVLD